jgi:predicted nucleic acid-binding protein
MKIVLDSNILFSDWLLNQAQMKALERYLSQIHDELCIPEVVIEETIRHFRRKYKDTQDIYERATQVSEIVGVQLPKMQSLEEAVNVYRAKLMARLEAINARILPLPSTNLKTLLFRDLDEKKPFNSSGKGFRDMLIWESVLEECMRHDEKIMIVTSDSDFDQASSDVNSLPTLHKDLIADLANAGFAPDRITLYKGLSRFNQEFALPLVTQKVYHFGEPVAGTFVESLQPEEMLTEHTESAIRDVRGNLSDLLGIRARSTGRVTFLRWPENVKIMKALDLGEHNIQVTIRTFIVFDAGLQLDDNELNRLMELSKDKIIMLLLDNRWDPASHEIECQVRLGIFADFVFVWNTQESSTVAMDMLSMGFTEQDLVVDKP